MITLRTNMTQYYVQADGIPQFIFMMEDAQKKAKQVGMPIAHVELVMMASAAVLAAQHFPREVDDWEGLPAIDRTWRAWKVAFCLAHLKRQRQLQASGRGEPIGGTNSALPARAATIYRLGTALNNLALVAANDTTVLQQLMASNLVLTTSNAMLTAANKKLSEALAKSKVLNCRSGGDRLNNVCIICRDGYGRRARWCIGLVPRHSRCRPAVEGGGVDRMDVSNNDGDIDNMDDDIEWQ
jgi:hypothetical protein